MGIFIEKICDLATMNDKYEVCRQQQKSELLKTSSDKKGADWQERRTIKHLLGHIIVKRENWR